MVMVPQVQMPDFAGTLMRGEQFQQSRLQALAARQALDDAARFDSTLAEIAPALAAGEGPAYDSAIGRLMGAGRRGFELALPLQQRRQQSREFDAIMPGGGAAPAAAAPAGGAPNPQWDDRNLPRGLRNNNPLNLTYVAGQPGVQGTDGRFGRYSSLEDGVAAGVRQLQIYGQRGINTLERIVSTWAPPNENNTQAYIAAVARATGLDPRAPVDLSNPDVVARLVAAMGQHENGRPVPMDAVQRGVRRALGGGAAPADAPAASAATIPASANAPTAGAPTPAGRGPNTPGAPSQEVFARAVTLAARGNENAQRFVQAWGPFMRQNDTTDSFRDETREINGRRVAGQVNVRTGQFSAYPGQTDRPEGITPAQAIATVRRLGPQIAQGAISPTSPEYDDYAIAYEVATRATPVWVDDPNNPGTQRQQMQPGLVLDPARFPRPGGSGNGPAVGPTPAGPMTSPASATVPASGGNDASPVAPDPRTRTDPAIQPTSGDRTRLRALEVEAQGVLDAFQAFREARNSAGLVERGFTAAGIPTPLATAWTNAALLAKGEALFNLGVLNGPDLQIIQRAISDPSTMRGFFTGNATAEAQIQQIENLIRSRLESARRQYGAPLPPAPQGQTAGPGNRGSAEPPPPAPRRTAPAIGTVEDGFRFRGGDPSSPSNWERVR